MRRVSEQKNSNSTKRCRNRGVVIPALVYWFFNFNSPDTIKGWAITIATDTAFMIGILCFFGEFISNKLRAFIIGFSLIDDTIALLILAVFYTTSASFIAMAASVVLITLLFILNRLKIISSFYYLSIGIFLWIAMVESGIHGTLCGVILALAIPVEKKWSTQWIFSWSGKCFKTASSFCNITIICIHQFRGII